MKICCYSTVFIHTEMARDSAVGRERVLVVPGSLALDNTTTNQHVAGVQNDLNQQILEVSFSLRLVFGHKESAFVRLARFRLNWEHYRLLLWVTLVGCLNFGSIPSIRGLALAD